MYGKALVLVSALVAGAGLAAANDPGDAARATGQVARPVDERSRAGRATVGGHVQDDYADALAHARRRHVPVVVDVWAPW